MTTSNRLPMTNEAGEWIEAIRQEYDELYDPCEEERFMEYGPDDHEDYGDNEIVNELGIFW